MKKGDLIRGIVRDVDFPNKGHIDTDEKTIILKDVIEGQEVDVRILKNRENYAKGRLVEVVSRSPLEDRDKICENFGECGGCFYQLVSYENQLKIKEKIVRKLISPFVLEENIEGIVGSPLEYEYRNKMEFSFGDAIKGGKLNIGLHRKNSKYDILDVSDCKIVDADYRAILSYMRDAFRDSKLPFYNNIRHEGYLRHLLIRKAYKTGEILVDIVTTSLIEYDFSNIIKGLLNLQLTGNIVGILNTITDTYADTIKNDDTKILYGRDYFIEKLFDLEFKVSIFSFFQTNSLGAERLYSKVIEYLGDCSGKVVFDLYSGTGTIAQIVAGNCSKVYGVEIVEEAVIAARENTKLNKLDNCEFIAGDVLKVVDELEEKPDVIILDPPRDGIHPKAIGKIIDFGVDKIVYVSCKPTSLSRDLEIFCNAGYEVEKACMVDMFPMTCHVESVVLMSRVAPTK